MERGCSVEGCERKFYGLGVCQRHWDILKKNGTPTPVKVCTSCGDSFIFGLSEPIGKGSHIGTRYCDSCVQKIMEIRSSVGRMRDVICRVKGCCSIVAGPGKLCPEHESQLKEFGTLGADRACHNCGVLTRLSSRIKGEKGSYKYCKPCKEIYVRWQGRSFRHGVTPFKLDAIFNSQDGKCMTCDTYEGQIGLNGKPVVLQIDHDHDCCQQSFSCGKCIRGFLCQECNHAEGIIRSRGLECINSIIEYVKKYEEITA